MPPLNVSYEDDDTAAVTKTTTTPDDGKKESPEVSKKSTVKYFNESIGSNDDVSEKQDDDHNIISYQKKNDVKKSATPATPAFNKTVTPCEKPCLSLTKREILTDDNPETDKLMGNDGHDLDEETKQKIRKAEKLYKFARNVIDVVANNTVIRRKRRDDDLIGVWSGLGTVPEFVHYKEIPQTKGEKETHGKVTSHVFFKF